MPHHAVSMGRQKGILGRRLARAIARFRGEESQNRFARRLGISNATLNRIENQVQNVSLATLEQLCRALRCDVTDLFPPELARPCAHSPPPPQVPTQKNRPLE